MISITYSADQKALAEQIRDDLAAAGMQPAHPVLIVLVSEQSNADPSVQQEIEAEKTRCHTIIPILTESVALPASLDDYKPLNMTSGYKSKTLFTRLSQSTMTRTDVATANRRAMIVIGIIALVMFGFAIVGIMGGVVAFPVKEYNEEATYEAEWVNGLIYETLEAAQPRTTQDAENFDATLEAVPTRVYLFIRETATALPNTLGD
jgi:hypothetical protein